MDQIEKIIISCNKELLTWVKDFHNNTQDYANKSGNTTTVLYERTLSSIMNLILYNQIVQNHINSFMVNEFYVKNNTITTSDWVNGEKEVGTKVAKKWSGYCVFDGYFYFDNKCMLKVDNNDYYFKHFFVEYKLNNRFVYLDLATDYLKFKLFTKSISNESGFAYAIFNKNECNPSITHLPSYNGNHYYLIGKAITSASIPPVNVYVYLPRGNVEKKIPTESEVLAALKLKMITDEVEKLDSIVMYNDDEMKIINYSTKFNKKVITSKLILHNYQFIKKIWDEANAKGLFSDINNLDNCKTIEKGAEYNKNLENFLNVSEKADAERNGLTASYKTSLNYLILLDYFGDKYLGLEKGPEYKTRTIGRGNNKQEIDDSIYARNLKVKIGKHLSQFEDEDKRTKELVYSLVYIITNLVPILFDIKNDAFVEKDSYKLSKLKDKFNELLSFLKKGVGYEGKLNFDTFIDKSTDNNEVLLFLKKIFDSYQ